MRKAGKHIATAMLVAYLVAVVVSSHLALGLLQPLTLLLGDWGVLYAAGSLAFAVGFVVGRWIILAVALIQPVLLAGFQVAGRGAQQSETGAPLSAWWAANGWWPLFWEVFLPLVLGVVVRRRGMASAARAA